VSIFDMGKFKLESLFVCLIWVNGQAMLQDIIALCIMCHSSLILYLYSSFLAMNTFTGTLPTEIGSMTGLTEIMTDRNYNLTGSIPSEIGLLTSLELIWMHKSRMTGTIPSEIGSLTNLISIIFCKL